MAQNFDIKPYVELMQGEFDLLVATVREKGAKRFGKAIGIALIMVALAYAGVYLPPQKKSARLQSEIDAARALSQFAGQYSALRAELDASYAMLPLMKDREQWLSNAVIDSLKAEALTPETFQPVREQESSGLLYQSSNVTMPIRFSEFYSWLLRLEGAKPLMHIHSADLNKKTEPLGMNILSCEITTVIPKRRFE